MRIAGHQTSISIEREFWDVLKTLADRRGVSLNRLIEQIDAKRDGNLSSAIRVYVLQAVLDGRAGATEPNPVTPSPTA